MGRTSCMTLARSFGGNVAISSGLMLTSFKTTSCSRGWMSSLDNAEIMAYPLTFWYGSERRRHTLTRGLLGCRRAVMTSG